MAKIHGYWCPECTKSATTVEGQEERRSVFTVQEGQESKKVCPNEDCSQPLREQRGYFQDC